MVLHTYYRASQLEGIKHLIQDNRYCHVLVTVLGYKYCTGNGGKELIPKEKRNVFKFKEKLEMCSSLWR